jgi:hypothetical protein
MFASREGVGSGSPFHGPREIPPSGEFSALLIFGTKRPKLRSGVAGLGHVRLQHKAIPYNRVKQLVGAIQSVHLPRTCRGETVLFGCAKMSSSFTVIRDMSDMLQSGIRVVREVAQVMTRGWLQWWYMTLWLRDG